MMIKFLARGTGSAAAAADYLTREGSPEQDPEKNRKKSPYCGAIPTRWPLWPMRLSSSTSTRRA